MKIVILSLLTLLFIGCSDNAKEEVQNVEATKVEKAVEKIKEVVAQKVVPITEKSVEEAQKIVKEVKAKVAKNVAAVTKELSSPSAKDGKTIFTVCAGCHGSNAEKAALGKSKIIKGWSVAQVTDALNGYKDGTYGGIMKGVMKGQALKLSDSDIKSVAEYISSL